MSYTVIFTTTKPSDVSWYNNTIKPEQHSEGKRLSSQWKRNNPNKLISVSRVKSNDNNTITKTMVFEDQAAYEQYQADRETNPYKIAKEIYNKSNGIVIVKEVL